MSLYAQNWRITKWAREKLGFHKPRSLPLGEWENWEHEARKRWFAFFLTETVPDLFNALDRMTLQKLNNIRYYLVNRFADQTHVIHTSLQKGQYHEVSTRLLHSTFELLVHFVESECAGHNIALSSKEDRKKYSAPWWRAHWFTRWKTYRSPEVGVAYLDWCMSLDDPDKEDPHPPQATSARETFALYNWWKFQRPNRPDPYESTVGAFWLRMRALYGKDVDDLEISLSRKDLTDAENAEYHLELKNYSQAEQEYGEEDEAMMIRLIKHREHLWT